MSKTATILILDDQPQWRLILSSLLKKEDYQLLEATNSEKAKKLIDNYNIDLALLDLRLDDEEFYNVEGLEVLHRIKDKNPNTKCILITGYPEAIQNPELLKKYDDILNKPFDSNRFIMLVKKFVDTQSNEKNNTEN